MVRIDSEKVIRLNEKWNGKICPICGLANWIITENVYELREYNDGGLISGGTPIIPIIPIVCMNCGNTILVNAVVAGIPYSNNGI